MFLVKQFSIRENHLFRKTYKQGRKKGAATLVVYVLRDKSAALLKKQNPLKEKLNRVGISASKKIGGAVQRNRAKRVVREAYRMIDNETGIKKGFLIVIVPREKCTVCSMPEVKEDLYYCLREMNMLTLPEAETESEPQRDGNDADDTTECAL